MVREELHREKIRGRAGIQKKVKEREGRDDSEEVKRR